MKGQTSIAGTTDANRGVDEDQGHRHEVDPADALGPLPVLVDGLVALAKGVKLEKRAYFPPWIGPTCMARALVQLAGSPFREPVSTYLSAKLLLQLQPSIWLAPP